jgi:broad specificity phosphatase PhoE
MRAARLALSVLLGVTGGPAAAESLRAPVFLVRHAERDGAGNDPSDPGLSPLGRERALSLARVLGSVGLARVLSTDYRRTRETAGPVAAALGLEIELYDPEDLPGLAERLLGEAGPTLVVGHSNTTGEVAALLGGDPGPPFDEAADYDRLYVVTPGRDGPTTLLLRYGPQTGEAVEITPR